MEVEILELGDKLFEVFGGELGVEGYALFFLNLVYNPVKVVFAYADNDIRIHLDEPAVAVVGENGGCWSHLARPSTEMSVRPRLRMVSIIPGIDARRRCGRIRGRDSRGRRIFLPASFSTIARVAKTSSMISGGDFASVIVIPCAGFGRDGESGRHGHAQAGHLSEVGALTAEQSFVVAICLSEQVNILLCH